MTNHIEIDLGGAKFKASYFTFEQGLEARSYLEGAASGEHLTNRVCTIVAMGLSEHHPDMTVDALRKMRGPLSQSLQLFAAYHAILKFNEYEFDDTGKAPADAATA